MPAMNPDETSAFLEQAHIAHLVTLRADGSPHVAPVWYESLDDAFVMFTPSNSQKVRNLALDTRASLSVASVDEPYRYVVVEGTVEVGEMDFEQVALRIATRYQGIERGQAFVNDLRRAYSMVVLTLRPQRVMTYLGEI